MSSLFNKDPENKTPLDAFDRQRIEHEIGHLSQRGSVRHGGAKPPSYRSVWFLTLVVLFLAGLFFMDPPIHSLRRGEAIRAYSYLHHYGSDKKAGELLATGVFTPNEIDLLNQRQGSFHDYYSGPMEASAAADSIIQYLQGVANLQSGNYEKLDLLDKIRYQLFFHFGLKTPTAWSFMDPSVPG